MNFVETYKEGQKGKSVGFPMGKGLQSISRAIGGVQKKKIYSVAAAPKVGKTTLVDNGWVIEPCLYYLFLKAKLDKIVVQLSECEEPSEREILNETFDKLASNMQRIKVLYLSYEIDRVSKEFDYSAHFLARDYGLKHVLLPSGKTYQGKNYVPISADYLMGNLVYDSENETEREVIKLNSDVEDKLKIIYKNRIIPLFGEYDSKGNKISEGLITLIEERDNPTGIRNSLIAYASKRGTIHYNSTSKSKRIVGYTPNDPNLLTLIVTDHIRKFIPERNFTTKQTIDKFSEYCVEFRNLFHFSFVHIIHLNRNMADVQRRKLDGDQIYPTSDDLKDTGNLSEDSNYIFTMFNPNDDRYGLNKHFGAIIKKPNGDNIYPNMRTIHLVENRHGDAPLHFRVNMLGATKQFEKLIIN